MTLTRARRAIALLGAALMLMSTPSHAIEADKSPLAAGIALLDQGDLENAEKALNQALAGTLGTQDRAAALIYLARIQLGDGRFAEADKTASAAIDELSKVEENRDQGMLLALMIRFEAAKGAGDDAKASEIAAAASEFSARQDQIAWSMDKVPGGVLHKASGTVLPSRVAGLAEFQLNTYDATGLDASLTYAVDEVEEAGSDTPSFVTTFLTVNAGRSLAEQFQSSKQEILDKYPDAREITTGPIAVVQGERRLEGRMGVYAVREGGTQAFSTLHVFRLAPDINVRFRALYPVINAEAMRSRVAALMQAMIWPDGVTIQ